jgi:hypothetical protein
MPLILPETGLFAMARDAGRPRRRIVAAGTGVLAAALLGALSPALSPALAQAPASPPLPIIVSPSGVEPAPSEAQQRQERLLKRMQEDEFLFRNICVRCGGGVDKPGAYAPFNPAQALSGRPVPQ